MKARCPDTFREDRCTLPLGHDGMHRAGGHTWEFRDDRPEWRRRAEAMRRAHGMVAVKELWS